MCVCVCGGGGGGGLLTHYGITGLWKYNVRSAAILTRAKCIMTGATADQTEESDLGLQNNRHVQ